MTGHKSLLFYCFSSLFILTLGKWFSLAEEDRQIYIVYMGSLPHSQSEYSPASHHLSLLQEVLKESPVEDSLIRSYKRSFNGFAAKLTDKERQKLIGMKDVVSVFPSRTLHLQTTRSWDFMGFPETIHRNPTVESDVIIGVIDSGIWPESESFNDEGLGPVPKKWKGACHGGLNFTCNKKIIGARYYSALSDKSARDMVGHGTHIASTAAGRIVKNASFYGIGNGDARGGVPSARIAAYKVCNESSCSDVDILAAFDDAIADGVDIITISIGADSAVELNCDVIAIGAFHAMAKGVLTSHSAGNSGPSARTTNSVAPWLLSVAASNTDRRFFDRVVLGNGAELAGVSIHSFALHDKMLPLLYGEDAGTSCDSSIVRECFVGCLDRDLVRGKIVICDGSDSLDSAKSAGAVGVIVQNYHDEDVSFIVPLPAAELSYKDLDVVKNYKNSTKNPHAGISKSAATKVKAPVVVNFSSRGPNTIVPEILKPDISAPGVEILAAYSPVAPVSESSFDKRSANYSILSGTSMSCPHATGAAAYVKSLNPQWSPSAIKSALMTTAWPMDPKQNEDAEFAYGSGHIDPVKAANPGLVYESSEADFIKFLCDMGYDQEKIKRISGDNVNCPQKSGKKGSPKDLNYPSMAVSVRPNKPFKVEFHRTVTNVGSVNSTYEAKVDTKSKIQITVVPSTLSFNSVERTKSFVVTVAGKSLPAKALASASLLWSDGSHEVRSPLVVYASDR